MGLPEKPRSKKLIPFNKKCAEEKVRHILKWFVHQPTIQNDLSGNYITENRVETIPEKVNAAVLDEDVDIYIVKDTSMRMRGCQLKI